MKHLAITFLLCACESWNTPAPPLVEPPTELALEIAVRIGGTAKACSGRIAWHLSEAADLWCEYTDGEYCPVITVTAQDDAGEATCRYDDGERTGHATMTCPEGRHVGHGRCRLESGEAVLATPVLHFRPDHMESDSQALKVALHELGHLYDWMGGVDFVGADRDGHTPGGVMGAHSRSLRMPELEDE